MISPLFRLSGSHARGLLYGLLETDKIQLRENPLLPSMRQLVQSGKVKYRQADPDEHWQSYLEIVDQVKKNGKGYADCEDLATAIAAEDQVRYGVASLPFAYSPREGLFHVVTAVPQESFGAIPRSSWPIARSAPPVSGYVLQDPSAAAGMGSDFNEEAAVGYGNDGSPRRRRGSRPGGGMVGRAVAGLGRGLGLGKTVSDLGSGLREGAGVSSTWASDLGRTLGSSLSPLGSEQDVVDSLIEGSLSDSSQVDASSDEDLADFDDEFGLFEDDDDDDDEFGFDPEDRVGSVAWEVEQLANRVSDDLFGSDDDFGAVDDGPPRSIGLFREHLRGFHDGLHEDLDSSYGSDSRFMPIDDRTVPLPHLDPSSHRGPIGRPMASFDGGSASRGRRSSSASGPFSGSVFGSSSLFGFDLDDEDDL